MTKGNSYKLSLKDYQLSLTSYQHMTESKMDDILTNQKLHHQLVSSAKSHIKQYNRLKKSTKRHRRQNKKKLENKWSTDLGIPLSIQNGRTEDEVFELMFNIYQFHMRMEDIQKSKNEKSNLKNGTSPRKKITAENKSEIKTAAYQSARRKAFGKNAKRDPHKSKKSSTHRSQKTSKMRGGSKTARKMRAKMGETQKAVHAYSERLTQQRSQRVNRREKQSLTARKIKNEERYLTHRGDFHDDMSSSKNVDKNMQNSLMEKILRECHENRTEALKKYGDSMPTFVRRIKKELLKSQKHSKRSGKKSSRYNSGHQSARNVSKNGKRKFQNGKMNKDWNFETTCEVAEDVNMHTLQQRQQVDLSKTTLMKRWAYEEWRISQMKRDEDEKSEANVSETSDKQLVVPILDLNNCFKN